MGMKYIFAITALLALVAGRRLTCVPTADIFVQREINDADGDGVEDNEHHDVYSLERFTKPAVFHSASELHNTLNGEPPGHGRKKENKEPEGHFSDLIEDPMA